MTEFRSASLRTCILTSRDSWFLPHAKTLRRELEGMGARCDLATHHREVDRPYDVTLLLSYFELVSGEFLCRHRHNVVVHESALPRGRGWAPLFWQVIEGRCRIPVVLFEAREGVDAGPIYLRDEIQLEGHELHDELREKQAEVTRRLCRLFVERYRSGELAPSEQAGEPTHYRRRTPEDSRLDPEGTIAEQFDLLRTVSNDHHPAFFDYRGHRYLLKIEKAGGGSGDATAR